MDSQHFDCLASQSSLILFSSLFLFSIVFSRTTKKTLKMKKELLILLSVLIGLLSVSQGAVKEVRTAQELIELFEGTNKTTVDSDIILLSDLDFSGANLTIPLGSITDFDCVSFSGKLQGNGHSIKGLTMDNSGRQDFMSAALFCSLENATIENLVVDQSCSFKGEASGSIASLVTGSLVMRNVINKAPVEGTECPGGFFGWVYTAEKGKTLVFDKCVNEGNISGSSGAGGFVGQFVFNINSTLTMSNCENKGNVVAEHEEGGGFVGTFRYNYNMNVCISQTTNYGNVSGAFKIGGFAGSLQALTYPEMVQTIRGHKKRALKAVETEKAMSFVLSQFTNNGHIVATPSYYYKYTQAGGIIGALFAEDNKTLDVTISGSVNNEDVHCIGNSSYAGGLVGYVDTPSELNVLTLKVASSFNGAIITAINGTSCGLFCVNSQHESHVQVTVLNSINKGDIDANVSAYGIANSVTKASNVVSMGTISESSSSYSFWKNCSDKQLLYGMACKCMNCESDTKLFEHNSNTGFYDVTGNGGHVHEMLNKEVTKEHYSKKWTAQLEHENSGIYPSSESDSCPASSSNESGSHPLTSGIAHILSPLVMFLILFLTI